MTALDPDSISPPDHDPIRMARGEAEAEGVRPADDSSTAEQTGDRIGHYKLLQQIGEGGFEDHQAGDGHQAGDRALRSRASGAGDDGPFEHRQGVRRGRDGVGPALLRDGADQRCAHPRILRHEEARHRRATEALQQGVPRDPARAPERHHSPGHQAVERARHAARRGPGSEGDRLRHREGHENRADAEDALHRAQADDRDADVHVARASGTERTRHRHSLGHLLAGRAAVRAPDRHDAVRHPGAARVGLPRDVARDPRGRAAQTVDPRRDSGENGRAHRGGTPNRHPPAPIHPERRPRLDHHAVLGEGPHQTLRVGLRSRRGSEAARRRRAGARRPAERALPHAQVRAPQPEPRRCERAGAPRPACRRDRDDLGHARGRRSSATGQRCPAACGSCEGAGRLGARRSALGAGFRAPAKRRGRTGARYRGTAQARSRPGARRRARESRAGRARDRTRARRNRVPGGHPGTRQPRGVPAPPLHARSAGPGPPSRSNGRCPTNRRPRAPCARLSAEPISPWASSRTRSGT